MQLRFEREVLGLSIRRAITQTAAANKASERAKYLGRSETGLRFQNVDGDIRRGVKGESFYLVNSWHTLIRVGQDWQVVGTANSAPDEDVPAGDS